MAEERGALRLHLERALPASRTRVFAALTEAELLAAWWGPHGVTTTATTLDLRVGGRYRFAMHPPDAPPFRLEGEFREVTPPHRLAFTFGWDPPDPDDVETVATLSLDEAEGATRLRLDQGTFATRSRLVLHERGWSESLERLERLLAKRP